MPLAQARNAHSMADKADTLHQAAGFREDESWTKKMFEGVAVQACPACLGQAGNQSDQSANIRSRQVPHTRPPAGPKPGKGPPRYEDIHPAPLVIGVCRKNPRAAVSRLRVVLLVAHPQNRTTLTAEAH